MNLGPFAFLLSAILARINDSRSEASNGRFTLLQLGQQMPEHYLKDMMELVGSTVNLHGFLCSGNSRRKAQAEALDSPEKGKTATCIHVALNQELNFVKLNGPAFTPYHESESHVLLQDGLKLMLDSVEKEKVKVNGKNQTLVQIKLRTPGKK